MATNYERCFGSPDRVADLLLSPGIDGTKVFGGCLYGAINGCDSCDYKDEAFCSSNNARYKTIEWLQEECDE